MNAQIKLRLIAFAVGIALMGVAIGFLTVKSQRQAAELRAELTEADSESFHIAEQFGDYMRELTSALYRYGSQHEDAELTRFEQASHNLDQWIDRQKPRLITYQERQLMQQIDAAYDEYLKAAHDLQARLRAHAPESDYIDVLKESQNLSELSQALAKAHYQSRNAIVARANETISQWRGLVLASLAVLFVLAAALAYRVYRDMIAPLRLKLVESEMLLERREKLASLGLLAAGVAHEIRNPLTAIKAALFIQQRKFAPDTPEFADSRLVEREILRLERIVNDFLLFARPTEPQFATVRIDELLNEVRTLLAPQLARQQIELTVDSAGELTFPADAGQIKQVLINLVQNAGDAIGRDGKVQLRACAERKRLENREQAVVILEVTDNGKGIPAEVQERLFDPFFTTKDTGTGLGLSIAASLVQKHGGALQYQTQPGRGTTFGVILPASRPNHPPPATT
jgi:signal transduction histidine kinase